MARPAPSILVVEDDLTTRDVLARLLTAEGYNVRVAANGWEGLLSMDNPPQLIVLDIMLPGMDGYSFLSNLRRKKSHLTIPIIVVTALEVAEVAEKVKRLGVHQVISKADNMLVQLKATLKRVLAKPDHPYHVELPQPGRLIRPYLDVYLKMLAWS